MTLLEININRRSLERAQQTAPIFNKLKEKKLSSFIRSCIGDVICDRYEKAKIK
jgi:hypothetical protein